MAEPYSTRTFRPRISSDSTTQENGVTEHASVGQTKKSSMKNWRAEDDQRLLLLRAENKDMSWEEFLEVRSRPSLFNESIAS